MGILDLFNRFDINSGVKESNNTPSAVILDVRTRQEYAQGHIPGSKNIPLQELEQVQNVLRDKSIPIYTYCHSGARSRQAESLLKSLGFVNVKNIGGISSYRGEVER
ncbi:MAG TPA: rhodanese-like domain-containing protein [Saccharofermentans sp.]|nr:rhodanese-like domain-containing protein [Saccharofermentans sp.]HPE27883.1 rhodanese-like domain-containing protein [Saccharofermentans sp.]HPJ81423.1 rhodanese-like domain-containing protein [Saccharofermentans sp.]HPQ31748.1 rhodanese-like domain-containing protein [Saccharofermentans sp.]HRV50113.1 rhodanese-like domain-containing protein [Saccharofermentans sp.]